MEIGADKLATGHNMDDECQSIVMDIFGNDTARLARLGEIAGNKKFGKFVPRIKPLYDTPEKDIIAYAALNGIKHYSEECCPYSWTAKRNHFRKMLNETESRFPGTKHGIIASFRKMRPALARMEKGGAEIMECAECGELANSELCATCRQFGKIMDAMKKVPKAGKKKIAAGMSCADTKGLIRKNAGTSHMETKEKPTDLSNIFGSLKVRKMTGQQFKDMIKKGSY